MKTALRTALALLGGAASAFASGGATTEEGGLLIPLFLGFGACILVFQAIPAVILFCSMIRGLFPSREKAAVATGKKLG
ncbi:MAG TPA: hypothetical protein VL949_06975 [Geobacteraceae bacterium]|nr:hypothetical protein [Geobacteraceae bacterium]